MGEKLGDIMAQKTLSVLATLGKDQDSVQGWYDIFDLPYDKLSADNRLVINQDVCLGNAKNAFFPYMRYVDIQGTLNCGKYQIVFLSGCISKLTKAATLERYLFG